MDQDLIKKLQKDPNFEKFEKYVLKKIEALERFEDMKDIEELSDKRAGQEIKARKKAARILGEILNPFLRVSKRSEQTPEDVKEAKDEAGL